MLEVGVRERVSGVAIGEELPLIAERLCGDLQ